MSDVGRLRFILSMMVLIRVPLNSPEVKGKIREINTGRSHLLNPAG